MEKFNKRCPYCGKIMERGEIPRGGGDSPHDIKWIPEHEKGKWYEELLYFFSQEDEDKVYFLNDEMGADFDKIKEDQNFYIDDAGRMVLVFDEYEVAPGFMGIVEITIPETIYHADGL